MYMILANVNQHQSLLVSKQALGFSTYSRISIDKGQGQGGAVFLPVFETQPHLGHDVQPYQR